MSEMEGFLLWHEDYLIHLQELLNQYLDGSIELDEFKKKSLNIIGDFKNLIQNFEE